MKTDFHFHTKCPLQTDGREKRGNPDRDTQVKGQRSERAESFRILQVRVSQPSWQTCAPEIPSDPRLIPDDPRRWGDRSRRFQMCPGNIGSVICPRTQSYWNPGADLEEPGMTSNPSKPAQISPVSQK